MGLSIISTLGPLDTIASFMVLAALTCPDKAESRLDADMGKRDNILTCTGLYNGKVSKGCAAMISMFHRGWNASHLTHGA
jgi:hypothetical protein